MRKAVEALANMVSIPMTGGTIPHEVVGSHGAGKVLMKPAAPGAGVIAGGAVRAIMECAGIADILTKSLGSTNPHNMVLAALDGLQQLTTVEQIARERASKCRRSVIARAPSRRDRSTCLEHTCGEHQGSEETAKETITEGKVRIKQVKADGHCGGCG